MTNRKIAVIGAGPCGLTACKALHEKGLDFECLEASGEVGGIWKLQPGNGSYRSLQTNTSITAMAFTDFPFSETESPYRSAAEMLTYFNRYTDHFGLRPHIRFHTKVVAINPTEANQWIVQLEDGSASQYASIIVATGQYTAPRQPHASIDGQFNGQHMTVQDYMDVQTPIDLRNKTIMVVGLGSSAAELAAEISDPESKLGCAKKLILSARSGRWVMPKITEGVPLDARSPHASTRPPAPLRWLPPEVGANISRRIMGKLLRKRFAALGGAEGLGVPQPSIQPWEDRPTMSTGFVSALQAKRITIRPGIKRFDGDIVHFDDNSNATVDAIIYATGYELDFKFIDKTVLGCPAPTLSLYQRIVHPRQPGLYFVGMCRVMCPLWPMAEQQSRWLAALLNNEFELPSPERQKSKAISLQQSLPIMCSFYLEELLREFDFNNG